MSLPLGPSTAAAHPVSFNFENTYAQLPQRFHARVAPTPVAAPRLIQLNAALAQKLGFRPELLATAEGVAVLAGKSVAAGSEPLAMAYAGHQFGYFVPQLGDGRAILLGEVIAEDGLRYDVQLKGAGPTPFSRNGDGRAALGPVLREYLLSEAMAALGVPTTRAQAAVATGENVYRETILPGAVLTRVARSHLRVGTFQFFAARGDTDGLRTLSEFAIQRLYPDLQVAERPIRALLEGVVSRQAQLIARWMGLGFIHGVMNTDNMSIAGETIDYGPCAFMEAYHPETVFSSIDRQGRYAWGNQPEVALWNLTRLAEALLPLLGEESGGEEAALAAAKDALAGFGPQFATAHSANMARKLGLTSLEDADVRLLEDLLQHLEANAVDWTLFFRRLADAAQDPAADVRVRALFADPGAYDGWASGWHRRLEQEPGTAAGRAAAMKQVSPAYIPRNHRVEEAIAAGLTGDFEPFRRLLAVTAHPYEERPGMEAYLAPARPEERVRATFCGT